MALKLSRAAAAVAVKQRRVDLHYPCTSAYDDEDKSDEKEDAPAGEAAVGIACHIVL